MVVYANAVPGPTMDGIVYVAAAVLPTVEADLLSPAVPAPLPYEAAVVASVELTVAGGPSGNTMYVVLQTDLGDGIWYDVAWLVDATDTANGTYNFILAGGVAGANAFEQTRANNTGPSASGSNQFPLGARIRFTGKATLTGGANPSVTAKIRYKLTPLR